MRQQASSNTIKTQRLRKWMLVPFGILIGVVLFVAGLGVWRIIHPPPQWIDASDIGALHAMLDADRTPQGLCLFDEECGYRFKPSFFGERHESPQMPHETNLFGLLGHREPTACGPNVVVLGDSVTYGDGIGFESIFVSRIQRLAGDSCYIGAAACPGWSTDQQFIFFNRYLRGTRWDAVVLVVCLNDLVQFRWARLADGTYDMIMEEANSPSAAFRLMRISFRLRGDALEPLKRLDDATRFAWDEAKWQTYCSEVLQPFVDSPGRPQLIVTVMPTLPQLEALLCGASREEVLIPQDRMTQYCAQQRLVYVDVLPAFEGVVPRDCFRDDLHLSEKGHQFVADRLWSAIRDVLDLKKTG